MRVFHLKINGDTVDVAAPEPYTLLEILRYELGLTGSKQGCDKGDCGSCTVQVDGVPTLSCLTLPSTVESKAITTIEGLAVQHRSDGGEGASLLQNAFDAAGALQCGFCQPGMIMAVAGMLNNNPEANDEDIDAEITNICRCGTFGRVRRGVHLAKTKMA